MHLAAPGLSCGIWALGCDAWDLVAWTGIKPGTPTVRAWSLATGPPGKFSDLSAYHLVFPSV